MTGNHKLSALLKGRTVTTVSFESAETTISFSDGSSMTVQTKENATGGAAGATIHAVRQADTTLILDFEGGASMQMTTAEATSSVMVRDHFHGLEYAD